jgi:NADPH-dependent curcumin reductase CurA
MAANDRRSNRQLLLTSRPTGRITPGNFTLAEAPIPRLADGQALLKTLYLSIDPAMRSWMDDADGYMPRIRLGEVVRSAGIAQVAESCHPSFRSGELVYGLTGWQEFSVIDNGNESSFGKLPPDISMPVRTLTNLAGATGMAAYFGMCAIARPQPGETLVVTAAAGAVGSLAGQIGKIFGCRVTGVTSSDEKCRWLMEELGFDAAVNYKSGNWRRALEQTCPGGIDILFENAGGEASDFILTRLNSRARIVLCGLIASYHGERQARVFLAPVLMKRLRIEGFLVADYAARFDEALRRLARWTLDGRLQHRETIVDGLEQAPAALNLLFDGGNVGKLLVKTDTTADVAPVATLVEQ